MDDLTFTENNATQPKQILSQELVLQALRKQRNSIFAYLSMIAGLGIAVALGTFVFPLFYLFIVNCLIELKKMISIDLSRRKLQHHVILRPCEEKEIVEQENGPDVQQLWFLNRKGDLLVAVTVDREFYNQTQIGEEFYLVFAGEEKFPCLWYRKSQWELDESSWELTFDHQKEKV